MVMIPMHALKCIYSYAFAESTYAERSYRSFPYLATVSRVPFSPSSHCTVSLKQTKWRRPPPADAERFIKRAGCLWRTSVGDCMNVHDITFTVHAHSNWEWKLQWIQIMATSDFCIFLWIIIISVILVWLTLWQWALGPNNFIWHK